MTPIDYQKCLSEMYRLHRFGIKLGLDVIGHILKHLQNPQNMFSCIHIAGTNGKGSIASGLAHILQASGFRVGLYTSPHLVRFNERIKINGIEVSDPEIVESYLSVKSVPGLDRDATFFEYTTAMALQLFAKAHVDWAIIETGMGGRLDATNILTPKLCVISNISMEHRFYLGNSIAEITGEKGGIIKPDTPVVTGVTQKSAISVLENIAAEKNAPLFRIGAHFQVRRNKYSKFSYTGLDHHWKDMKTILPGDHQIDNAALILAACEILIRQGLPIAPQQIRQSLNSYSWPGRLEIIPATAGSHPEIIIDGAHNLMAARKLGQFLKQVSTRKKITLILGVLDDKPFESILQSLLPHCTRAILTEPKIDRRLSAEKLMPLSRAIIHDAMIIKDVDAAVRHGIETPSDEHAICIAGSLYVAGEAIQTLENMGIYRLSGKNISQTPIIQA